MMQYQENLRPPIKYKQNPNLNFLRWAWVHVPTPITHENGLVTIEMLPRRRGVLLEGSSRSGKTFSCIDFLIWLCVNNPDRGLVINIVKETYSNFKTTLYDDFNRRLPAFGLRSPFNNKQEVSTFSIFGNKINMLGADNEDKFHGASCDIFWINEALDVSQKVFDQLEMRCRLFWMMDYNPKCTDHWIFDAVEPRDNVALFRTTFRDNPFVSYPERMKILSYEPTEKNIQQGTASDFMWACYGLGLRSAPEGLIFQHITWINEFPSDIEHIAYGLDFGYTQSPSALVKVGVDRNNLYIKKLHYGPTPSSNELLPILQQYCQDQTVVADSADKGMISELRRAGLRVLPANKFQGSIKFGISLMKKHKIHVVSSPEMKREFNNYHYKEIQGIKLDEPEGEWDHAIDATRYAMQVLRIAA